jgi:protein-S-isoprenylcysteine O-methyltransferase Ste14
MKIGYSRFERNRRKITRAVLPFGLLIVLLTRHSWPSDSAIAEVLKLSGIALVAAGVTGRLWCTAYIGGRKNQELVTGGPYSMCRNPLYFFSFLAGLGVAFSFQNILLILFYVGFFSFYYPLVIASEEKRLHSYFGDTFLRYKKNVPAFFPNIFKLRLGGLQDVSYRLIFRSFLDASLFIIFIPIAWWVDGLFERGVLHAYLILP